MKKIITLLTFSGYAFLTNTGVAAQTGPVGLISNTSKPMSHLELSSIESLAPREPTSNQSLDYTVLSGALNGAVVRLGPSDRRRMIRPAPNLGSRFVYGHTSAYRLEGSRVSFSYLNEGYLDALHEYRKDLEAIGTEIDLTHLEHNEQLAYWFNLHNVAMIELIAQQYPKKYPSRLMVDGVLIDDFKFLNVKGVSLSLRDIREKIVFQYWDTPEVMYGFFRGDIGSPALQNFAYTGNNISEVLDYQAKEFINSLRGFNLSRGQRNVSKLYEEVRPIYFPNWDSDIKAHLLKYAREDVAEEIQTEKPWAIDKYEDTIADLIGGTNRHYPKNNIIRSDTTSFHPIEVIQLTKELDEKVKVLKKRGWVSFGRVTIEDVEPEDE